MSGVHQERAYLGRSRGTCPGASSECCYGGRRARLSLPTFLFGEPVGQMKSLGIQLAGLLKGRDRASPVDTLRPCSSGPIGCPGRRHQPRPAPCALGVWGPLADPPFYFLVQSCQFLKHKVIDATDPPAGEVLWRPHLLDDRVHTASCRCGVDPASAMATRRSRCQGASSAALPPRGKNRASRGGP
jgi:hypothetical protein